MAQRPVILIVGGGYVGLYTALRLQQKLRRGRAEVIVVDPQPHMTYQPFLPEAAAGSVEPRHVVVPLRRTLDRCRVITGAVTGISHAERTARIAPVMASKPVANTMASNPWLPDAVSMPDSVMVVIGSVRRSTSVTCGSLNVS